MWESGDIIEEYLIFIGKVLTKKSQNLLYAAIKNQQNLAQGIKMVQRITKYLMIIKKTAFCLLPIWIIPVQTSELKNKFLTVHRESKRKH